MKKPLISLVALTASVMSASAFAATNMENPLYMPQNREVYLKTGAGLMYKKTDHTIALQKKNADGKVEFPVWRFTADMGYGITDRLDIHGRFGYTRDGDIDRKGMHRGRIGLMFRALTEKQPFILDFYVDGFLSGVSKMKGTYVKLGSDSEGTFNFGNYSNGRWGVIGGTRFGKTWDKLTLAAHFEYLQTFGNHNNEIKISNNFSWAAAGLFPHEISVDLKSTHETCFGFDGFYQATSKWSFGGGFEFYQHSDNGVKSIHTKLPEVPAMFQPTQQAVVDGLLAKTADMKDGWDEYTLKASAGYQIDDSMQIVMFAEYTFDDSHEQSQNGTDIKAELGARFNARF